MTETATRRRRKPAEAAPSAEAAAGTAGDGRPLDRSDNQPPEEKAPIHKATADQLRSYIERIERLEEEKKTIADDIKDVYGELKGVGFDSKIVRKIVQLRKRDAEELAEEEALLDTYKAALGMLPTDYADE